jgi:hypothetical protein
LRRYGNGGYIGMFAGRMEKIIAMSGKTNGENIRGIIYKEKALRI